MPINFFTNKKTQYCTDSTKKETQYCTDFVITINSAYGLESVRKKHEMEVYAKVSLGAEPATQKRTPANKHGGRNPTWNCQMKYTIGKSAVDRHGLVLWIKLYCRRGVLRKDKYIGEVSVQIKNLYDPNFLSGGMTEPVRKGSKVSEGSLTFSFSFGDMYPMKKPSFLRKRSLFLK